jgi:hypothetical protein
LSFYSCDSIDKEEPIPSYIHIDSTYFNANEDSFGSNSNIISDVWVTVDQKFVGTFELPVTFPVLSSGDVKLSIRAGIIDNGINNTRAPYPFYTPYNRTINLQPERVDTIVPVFTYPPTGMGISFIEDFESSKLIFDKSATANIGYTRTNDPTEIFEGKFAAKAELMENGDFFEITSKDFYQFSAGKSVYLEMNYKTDDILSIGYYVVSTSGTQQKSVLNLFPTDEWKKIYINFGNEINFDPINSSYKVYIGAQHYKDEPAKIYLDNIKLLYFE